HARQPMDQVLLIADTEGRLRLETVQHDRGPWLEWGVVGCVSHETQASLRSLWVVNTPAATPACPHCQTVWLVVFHQWVSACLCSPPLGGRGSTQQRLQPKGDSTVLVSACTSWSAIR